MDCLDYLYLPRRLPPSYLAVRIHGWRSNLVLSTFTISTETSPSPNPYTFIWPLRHASIPNHLCIVPTFSGFRHHFGIHMSAESYSGVTLHPVPPNHNKWLLYKFQLLISLEWREFYLFEDFGQVIRQTIVAYLLFCEGNAEVTNFVHSPALYVIPLANT